jgi:hypothetical protein
VATCAKRRHIGDSMGRPIRVRQSDNATDHGSYGKQHQDTHGQ